MTIDVINTLTDFLLESQMREDVVEIYSDASNSPVMRCPGHNDTGILIQGDSLFSLWNAADEARRQLQRGDTDEALRVLDEVRMMLWERLTHYKRVMSAHGQEFPQGSNGPDFPTIENGAD